MTERLDQENTKVALEMIFGAEPGEICNYVILGVMHSTHKIRVIAKDHNDSSTVCILVDAVSALTEGDWRFIEDE